MNILHSIGAGITSAILFIQGLFGVAPVADDTLGIALPSGTADFESSLATGISDSATTMTLTSNSIRGGGSLSGYECFTVDEGSAQEEYMCGTVSATSVTGLERGLSPADGVTSTSSLQFAHRRGASVKITDFPLIQRIASQNSGDATFENVLSYATSVGTTTVAANGQNLASVAYANSLSFGGVAASASTSVSGFVELATGGEAASTTIFGSTGAMLALHTGISTSTAPSSGSVVVVTGGDGNIDANFLPEISKHAITTYTASSTYTKPSNLQFIEVEMWGAGGGGAKGNAGAGAGGGGGGSYKKFLIASSSLSATTSIVIGAGGVGSTTDSIDGTAGGNTTFGQYIAYGGGGGSSGSGGNGGWGGAFFSNGSTTLTSDFSDRGIPYDGIASSTNWGGGAGGTLTSTDTCNIGGNSFMGGAGGGAVGTACSSAGGTSIIGGNGGAGGVGVSGTAGTVPSGGGGATKTGTKAGDGAKGMVRITEYY
jgi:hypothetical protein